MLVIFLVTNQMPLYAQEGDEVINALGESEADIGVWLQTKGDSTITYEVKIEWGSMEFVYDYGAPKWNPATCEYEPVESEKGWNGITADNIGLTITNSSNAGVKVGLEFVPGNNLNWSDNPDMVVGNFYDSVLHAQAAAAILTGTKTAEFQDALNELGKIGSIELPTAEAYEETYTEYVDGEGDVEKQRTISSGPRAETVYFAFSGTPSSIMETSQKVGSISITVGQLEGQ